MDFFLNLLVYIKFMIAKNIYLLVHPFYHLLPALVEDNSELGFKLIKRIERYNKEYNVDRFSKLISGIYGKLVSNMALDSTSALILVRLNNETIQRMRTELEAYLRKKQILQKKIDALLLEFDAVSNYALGAQERFINFVKRTFRNKRELVIVDEYIYANSKKDTNLKDMLGRVNVFTDEKTRIYGFGEKSKSCVDKNIESASNLLNISKDNRFIIENATELLSLGQRKQLLIKPKKPRSFNVVKEERRIAKQRKPI